MSCVNFEALRPSPADVRVVTSDGSAIAAHSSVLASASPVLERMIGRASAVPILGASPDAVAAFLCFLYSPREGTGEEWGEAAMAVHGPALLALAHVPGGVAEAARLTAERAVDALKLAGLCDAPRLRLRCARLAGKDLAAVELSERWRFAARHDAALQLDLLHLLHDADQRKKRWERERASQDVYRQLSDAMASLERVFAEPSPPCAAAGEGCAAGASCDASWTCTARRGLVQLMRHFAGCGKKAAAGGGGCPHCKRIFQLLRLRPRRPRRTLQGSLVQQSQDEDAGRESGQDMEAPREEGGEGGSHGYSGQQGGAGGREEIMGKIQQQQECQSCQIQI